MTMVQVAMLGKLTRPIWRTRSSRTRCRRRAATPSSPCSTSEPALGSEQEGTTGGNGEIGTEGGGRGVGARLALAPGEPDGHLGGDVGGEVHAVVGAQPAFAAGAVRPGDDRVSQECSRGRAAALVGIRAIRLMANLRSAGTESSTPSRGNAARTAGDVGTSAEVTVTAGALLARCAASSSPDGAPADFTVWPSGSVTSRAFAPSRVLTRIRE